MERKEGGVSEYPLLRLWISASDVHGILKFRTWHQNETLVPSSHHLLESFAILDSAMY
jgi:hypothetical protein